MKHLAHQRGAALIEFALGLLIFLMFLLGVVDFSRMLYTWAAANEATRAGARYAVVCDDTTRQEQVLAYMQARLPQIQTIEVAWCSTSDSSSCVAPASCTTANCQGVKVKITNLKFYWVAPIVGSAVQKVIDMPEFSTYLPREIMYQSLPARADCAS